jgi:hypothetical protein
MRRSSAFLVLVLSVCWAGVCRADGVSTPLGWKEASRSRDLAIFYQQNDTAHARAYQAVGDVDAPPGVVYGVVTDVQAQPTFMPFIKESTILRRLSATETLVYQVISPPLISSRDTIFRITTTPGSSPTSVWRSAWTAIPDFQPERRGFVRLRIAEGTWVFEPLDGGRRSRVTYTSLTNIGGSVPGWMANMSTTTVIGDLYGAVRKRVAKVVAANPGAPTTLR